MKHCILVSYVSLLVCASLHWASTLAAEEFLVAPSTDIEELAEQVKAGDSVVFQDGIWNDVELKFESLPGTVDAPIHIRPQTPGRVVFSGETIFGLSGQHVTVSGFVFRDLSDVSDVVQLRTHSERHAHHCRFTDCVFEQTPDSKTGIESRWLSVFGTHNRIDHCYFVGKKSRGPTMVVWVSKDVDDEHRIDHNHFGPRPVLGRNGGETIRIGTSEVSESICRTVVESNYFDRCDGEAEIISNKSCENTYRYNVFERCEGALTLRHGHNCLVEGNIFLGKTKEGTGGVRIIGTEHRVVNNYFEGLRGDSRRAAICIMNGVPNAALNSFAPVRDACVAHNTLVDCKVSIEFGVGAGKKQSAAPTNCRFANNLFAPGKWELFRVHAKPVGAVWEGNKYQQGRTRGAELVELERADLHLKRATDGLLRPTTVEPLRSKVKSTPAKWQVRNDLDGHARGDIVLAGCDVPNTPLRKWASAENTGPTWMRKGIK